MTLDPMSPISGGALLSDRLRVDFNVVDENVFDRCLCDGLAKITTLSQPC